MGIRTYGIKHITTLSKAVQTLLEQRHFFLCAGSEDVSQGFQVTLILILPVVRIRNGDICKAIWSGDNLILKCSIIKRPLTFFEGPLDCRYKTPVTRPSLPLVLNSKSLIIRQLRPERKVE